MATRLKQNLYKGRGRYRIYKEKFERKLRGLIGRSDDMRPAFYVIGNMFRQSRRTIFSLKGPGQYPDFTGGKNSPYAKRKEYLIGRKYPLLYLTGNLRESVINKNDPQNISVIQKKAFAFGSRAYSRDSKGKKVYYAKYHNSDRPRSKIPLRKFIFWGHEAPRTMQNLTGSTRTFEGRAIKVLRNYIARDILNK